MSSPYAGYTVETKIPLADLPAAVDPSRLALNIFVYDSDTDGQDRPDPDRLVDLGRSTGRPVPLGPGHTARATPRRRTGRPPRHHR